VSYAVACKAPAYGDIDDFNTIPSRTTSPSLSNPLRSSAGAHQCHLACSFHALCYSFFPHLSLSSFDSSSLPFFMSIPPLRRMMSRITGPPVFAPAASLGRCGLTFDATLAMDFVRLPMYSNIFSPHFWQLYYTTFSVCFPLLFDLVPFTPTRPVLRRVSSPFHPSLSHPVSFHPY